MRWISAAIDFLLRRPMNPMRIGNLYNYEQMNPDGLTRNRAMARMLCKGEELPR